MCIAVFLWQSHPLYPFLLFLNRDEYHSRPTEPLAWWEDSEIVGGRDSLAGGTWLASTRHGRLAFLTNFREISSVSDAQSRGDLPVRFLQSKKTPVEFAEEILKEANRYNGFNLVVADLCSKTMVSVTNRPEDADKFVTEVSPGVHVLSNANLDTPWPKSVRLRENFKNLWGKNNEGELPIKGMVDELMTDTVKDDDSKLPHVFPPDIEYPLSSIFIDTRRPMGRYGTRSISALFVNHRDEVCFYERHLENESWKECTETFLIEKSIQAVAGHAYRQN